MGYAEVILKILEIKVFNEDVLLLVIDDILHGQRVPIWLGTLHINKTLDLVSETEMTNLSRKWKRGRLVTLLASKSIKNGNENSRAFTLDQVKGGIKLTNTVEILAFERILVQGLSKVRGHQQCINTVTEPPTEKYSNSITTATIYTCLKPGPGCGHRTS